MGKKKGHLYIQIGYDIDAEVAGMASRYIGIIKRLLPGNNEFNETPRKGNQVYSTYTIRIW